MSKRGTTLFTESGVAPADVVSLSMGAPGGHHLQSAARVTKNAAAALMVSR